MKKLEEKFLINSDANDLIKKDDKVLAALSGGADSVCMLYLLHKFKRRLKIEIAAAHVNHKLRGKDSDNDAEFAKEICDKLGIKFFLLEEDARIKAKSEKLSVEEAGREIRYLFFEKVCAENGFTKIATAHNSDDNAETVFLNFIKGSGITGLSGIPVKREKIIRPILSISKIEILSYLKQNKIPFKEDLTNNELIYERNIIRNEILPLIRKKINPSVDENINQNSKIFRNYSGFISKKISKLNNKIILKGGTLFVPKNIFEKADFFLHAELLKKVFEDHLKISPSYKMITAVLSLDEKQTGSSVKINPSLSVVKEREGLLFIWKKEKKFEQVKFKAGEKVKLNGLSLQIVESKFPLDSIKNNKDEFISADGLSTDFIVRRWEAGDKFSPLGMKGTKKLSDFLTEKKLSSSEKRKQLVLENGGKIIWVIGLRIDNSVKISEKTKKVYQLCLK